MRSSDLQRLFDYNYWANARLFAALDRLTPEQFVGTIAGSYGSIRNTLVHVLSAEWGWLDRCGGARRGDALKPDDYPTIDVLRSTWATVETEMRTFLSELSDANVARSVSFALGRGPVHEMRVGDLLEHAAMHAAHHRGQGRQNRLPLQTHRRATMQRPMRIDLTARSTGLWSASRGQIFTDAHID